MWHSTIAAQPDIICRFGVSLGFPKEAEKWKQEQTRRKKYDKLFQNAFAKCVKP
jgi:hypothetical protein